MIKRKPLDKKRYGFLTVIKDLPPMPAYTKSGRKISLRKVECLCDCGKTVFIDARNLWTGNSKSCGCWNIQANILKSKHSGSGLPEYPIWLGMKARCNNANLPHYRLYGGRGIRVCRRWDKSFQAFYDDMGPRPSKDHSIERKDNDKGYFKRNCIWATRKKQVRNRRVTVKVNYQGVMTALADVAESTGIGYRFIYHRLRNGWTIEEALKYPAHTKIKSKRKQTTNGK